MGQQEAQGYRDIFDRAVGEAKNFFRDAFDSATSGAGIYLRDGNPSSVTGKAAQAINRRQCEVWGKDPTAFRPAWSDQLSEICGPYLADKGLPVNPPEAKSPFEGGQCQGTIYQYVITADPATPGAVGAVNANAKTIGPITGWRTAVEGTRFKGYVTSRGNITAQSCGVAAGQLQPLQERVAFDVTSRGQINPRFSILGVCNNGPNNCGNPPPEYLPPSPYGPALPAPPRLVPGDPLSPDFDITVNPDGSIEVCSGDTCITINPGPNGELPGEEEPSGEPPLAPGDQGNPGSPSGNFQDEAEGEEPTKNLVGVLVQIVSLPNRANQFFNNFEVYTKGPYFVFFGGDGGYSQNPEAAIARTQQFYYAPPGCNRWRVVGNVGYTLNVTPYYLEN